MNTPLRPLALLLFTMLLLASPGRAADIVVTTIEDELDSPSGANISLREAIRDAGSNPSTITFDEALNGGVIKLKAANVANGGPLIRRVNRVDLVIDALSLPNGITIDAGYGTTFFHLLDSKLTLRGLTLTQGIAGRTVDVADTNLSISPIYAEHSSLTLEFCTVSDNASVYFGGAISTAGNPGDEVRIANCTFVGNGVSAAALNSTLAGQVVDPSLYGGGALRADGSGRITVVNSTFTQNTANGGLALFPGLNRLDGNRHGGAILLSSFRGEFLMLHCTVANRNFAPNGGSGLAVVNSPSAKVTVANSILTSDVILAAIDNALLPPKLTVEGVCIIPNLVSRRTDGATTGSGTRLTSKEKEVNLKPLDNYGGRTQTLALGEGSPAIDQGGVLPSTLDFDQRGFPRQIGRRADIGAFEFDPLSIAGTAVRVQTEEDKLDPPGPMSIGTSLREAVRDLPKGGKIILFNGNFELDPARGPLRFGAGSYEIVGTDSTTEVTTIDGGAGTGTRIFEVEAGTKLILRRLTIKGGKGLVAGGNASGGGAIANRGALTLIECSLEKNSTAFRGGAIENVGTLLAQRCAFLENMANTIPLLDETAGGGALANLGRATLEYCTFSGNTATYGGAIDQTFVAGAAFPSLTLNHCTISGNTAQELDGGGGVFSFFDWKMTDTIIAGNTALALANDVTNSNAETFQTKGLTATGKNIVPALLNTDNGKTNGTILTSDPKLGTLDANGGRTKTFPLMDGSPAIDGGGSLITDGAKPTDQRGFPIVGKADIGAYEAGGFVGGSYKVALQNTTPPPAAPERAVPAAAPLVLSSGDSELTLDVMAGGAFTGTLNFAGIGKYTFKGQLDENRTATFQATGKNLPTLNVTIKLSGAFDENIEASFTGAGIAGSSGSPQSGRLVPARNYTAPPEIVGRYTGSQQDAGTGVAGVVAFEVTKKGFVRLAGLLNDGTAFLSGSRIKGTQQAVDLAVDTGRVPLYKKKGYAGYHMALDPEALFSTLTVKRPPNVKPLVPASLVGGFEVAMTSFATRYIKPPKGAPVLPGFGNQPASLRLKLNSATTLDIAHYDFTLPPTSKATSTVQGLKLKVDLKTGIFAGTIPNPAPDGPLVLPMVGVLTQDSAAANGYGLSRDAQQHYYLDIQIAP